MIVMSITLNEIVSPGNDGCIYQVAGCSCRPRHRDRRVDEVHHDDRVLSAVVGPLGPHRVDKSEVPERIGQQVGDLRSRGFFRNGHCAVNGPGDSLGTGIVH